MKILAKESYHNRKNNLFEPGFLEKASKKIMMQTTPLLKLVRMVPTHGRDILRMTP